MRTIGEVYLHVGNGGVTFEVIDEGNGPTIVVSSSFFGNVKQELKIFTNKEGLEELTRLFRKASDFEGFSGEYCHLAEYSDPFDSRMIVAGSTEEEFK
jgi:hypothetical protein